MAVPSTAPLTANTDPIDRSISPTTSTKVMATARVRAVGSWLAMVLNDADVRNESLIMPKPRISTVSTTTRLNPSLTRKPPPWFFRTLSVQVLRPVGRFAHVR